MVSIVMVMGIVDLASAFYLFQLSGGIPSFVALVMVYKGLMSFF
jgi:hypothetical protein